MATKHEQILDYIANLAVGKKISVRSIAKHLKVSEGTAYRAIKEAENTGFVSTIARVGTIRIEQKPLNPIESVTFKTLVDLIDAKVLGGQAGMDKKLDKFVIGAMTPAAMRPYITRNSLLIVGNREDAQRLALEDGAAVLITGGFETSSAIIALADDQQLPVLQTAYDTFTVATMINRALSDQAIKQDILTVAAIYTPLSQIETIGVEATVGDYLAMTDPHYPLPVVTRNGRLVGLMRPALAAGKKPTVPIERLMQKDPQTVKPYLCVTTVGHTMQDNGMNAMPVVDDSWNLLGIVTRNAVFSSLTGIAHSRELTNTIADQVSAQLTAITPQKPYGGGFELKTVPAMTNTLGTMSFGVLAEAINSCTTRYLHDTGRRNVLVEGVNLTTFRPVQLESIVTVLLRVLELTRHDATLDVDVLSDGVQVAKAVVTCQLLERN